MGGFGPFGVNAFAFEFADLEESYTDKISPKMLETVQKKMAEVIDQQMREVLLSEKTRKPEIAKERNPYDDNPAYGSM